MEPILKAGAKVEIQGDRAGSWQNPGGPEGLLREENGEGCPKQRLHCEQRHRVIEWPRDRQAIVGNRSKMRRESWGRMGLGVGSVSCQDGSMLLKGVCE